MAQLIVGLDIGTSAVRAAEVDVGSTPPALVTYGQVGLPPGSIVDGEIVDQSAVTEAVKRLWAGGQFSRSTVIVGIAGLRAITREIDLPFVPDNEVDSAVRFQSEEVIPFPPDKTILSSQILADYTSPEGDKMRRVLVAAAHADLVDGVVAAIEGAGVSVEGVDLISSALVRALSDGSSTDQPEAIVSVGAGLTVVVVHQQGRPQFVRTIGSGGNATTAAIAAALDLPLSDAEALKRRLGDPTPQVQAGERSAQPAMIELVGEIRNSIQYFASLPGRLPVSRVLVTGGGSYLHGFLPMLEAQLHLPVSAASPLARMDISKVGLSAEQLAQVGAVLSAPIGLALPEVNPAVRKFNLIPPEVAKRTRIKRLQGRTLAVAGVVLVLLLGFGIFKYFQVRSAQNNVNTLNSEITTINSEIPKYDLVVAASNAYNAGVQRRASVLNAAVDWPSALGNLIAITPKNIEVQAFSGTTGNAPTSGATSAAPATAGGTASAVIGSVSTSLTGPGPGLTSPSQWIQAIAGDTPQLFVSPVPSSVVTNPNGSVSFPSSISITALASLAKNASIQ